MPIGRLTPELIAAAIEGYEAQKTRIDGTIAELRALLPGGRTEVAAMPEAPTRKRKVSAAARRKMALAQKARWAKVRGESEPAPEKAPKAKRKMSKEGLARIVAATKKRWAAMRAAKAQQEKAAAKKAATRKTAKKTVAKRPQKVAAATVPAAG
jgi:hypothetical protein